MNKQTKRILLIDDDRKAIGILRAAFKKNGYEVLEAYDVESGLEILRAQAPDLLILDLLFPHTGGLDALGAIREEQAFADLPIIILTNYSNAEVLEPMRAKYNVTVMIKSASPLKEVVTKAEELLKNKNGVKNGSVGSGLGM